MLISCPNKYPEILNRPPTCDYPDSVSGRQVDEDADEKAGSVNTHLLFSWSLTSNPNELARWTRVAVDLNPNDGIDSFLNI